MILECENVRNKSRMYRPIPDEMHQTDVTQTADDTWPVSERLQSSQEADRVGLMACDAPAQKSCPASRWVHSIRPTMER